MARVNGAEGIGLCRTEHMFFSRYGMEPVGGENEDKLGIFEDGFGMEWKGMFH